MRSMWEVVQAEGKRQAAYRKCPREEEQIRLQLPSLRKEFHDDRKLEGSFQTPARMQNFVSYQLLLLSSGCGADHRAPLV